MHLIPMTLNEQYLESRVYEEIPPPLPPNHGPMPVPIPIPIPPVPDSDYTKKHVNGASPMNKKTTYHHGDDQSPAGSEEYVEMHGTRSSFHLS